MTLTGYILWTVAICIAPFVGALFDSKDKQENGD